MIFGETPDRGAREAMRQADLCYGFLSPGAASVAHLIELSIAHEFS